MENPQKGTSGLRRLVKAFRYSLEGLSAAFKHEDAFRQEIIAACVFIPLAFLLHVSGLEKAVMIGSILLVMIVELINSAIEATVDRISLEKHALAKRAKDLGSAAVLFSVLNAIVIWSLILLA